MDALRRVEPGTSPGRAVVTGAAGFIGSHLVQRLLASGEHVTGIDLPGPWAAGSRQWSNLAAIGTHDRFRFCAADLRRADVVTLLDGASVVYHLAAQPGVHASWGAGFATTCELNVGVTQRVLDAALTVGGSRVVVASSSSVYGDGGSRRSRRLEPISPYGVSKVAAEHLAEVYGRRGLDVVRLRYFTVYGPRQRPDMAVHRLFEAAAPGGTPFVRRGDGTQRRAFTYVDDVVEATVAAGRTPPAGGAVLDIGSPTTASLDEVIDQVAAVTGRRPTVVDRPEAPGDPDRTEADLAEAHRLLGRWPVTPLAEGLAQQWRWHRRQRLQADVGSARRSKLQAATPPRIRT